MIYFLTLRILILDFSFYMYYIHFVKNTKSFEIETCYYIFIFDFTNNLNVRGDRLINKFPQKYLIT